MALEEHRELTEILLRFEGGALRGAHAQYVEGVKKNGEWLTASLGAAIPLSLVDDGDQPTLGAALGSVVAALLVAKEAAETDALAARNEMAAKDANLQDLLAEVADLRAWKTEALAGPVE